MRVTNVEVRKSRMGMGRLLPMAMLAVVVGAGQGLGQETSRCGTTTWDLTAGQTTDVGSVTVANDLDNIYVTYTLDYAGATFGTLHLWIGNNLLSMPQNGNGTPIPGQFCQVAGAGGACHDATGLTTYMFTIPFTEISYVDANDACPGTVYVVTHAEVNMEGNPDDSDDEVNDDETAFGGPTGGGGPRWWFYGQYTICCDFGNVVVPFCQTAFAKGGYVWTTDKKSNPEKLPSLNLTKNRWGWAINLDAPGTTTYPIWAGAGLNKTSNGTEVGELTVVWDGATVTVTYLLTTGCLKEVHLYAGDASPTTIAPGQYGNLDSNFDNNTTYMFTVDVEDASDDGIWIVAHAVVCTECD